MEKKKVDQCALCRQNKELRLSHIVPDFVGRRLKSTSPGSIRVTNEPNKVVQDIEKHFMLCHECEEIFSIRETWFANNVFNPYQNKSKMTFDYNENLTYFIISLSWRSLFLDLAEFVADPSFDKDILMKLFRAEAIMHDYLLGKRTDIGMIENHIFFMDRIKSVSKLNTEKNPSVAMHRSISSYTAYNGNTSFTVSNLMGILVVTFYSMDANEQWINTKVNLGVGRVDAKNQHMTSVVGQEIQHWMSQSEIAQKGLSAAQQKKINDKFLKIGEDIKKYPIYQDFQDDKGLR